MNGADSPIYRFAEMEIDPQRQCLRVVGQEYYLRPKTFRVLVYLVEQRQRLVTKDELINQVWDGAAVSDDTLVQCIVDIRKALGDDSRNPRFVKTLPKIGYRFISPVEELRCNGAAAAQSSNSIGAVEFEEITSFEVEIEEEDDGSPMAARPAAHTLPAPQRRFSRRRMFAVSLALAVVMALGGWSALRGRRPEAEVKLPQVPGKKALAVLFFENRSGAPELDWLREGLADMLISNFSRSPKLSVLSRQQLSVLLDRIGYQRAEKIPLEKALEIADKTRAEVIAVGSFAQLGDKVRLDVQLHDARTGQLLTTESLIVDKPEDILTQVDLLSLKLAGHLGIAPSEPEAGRGLTAVMTSNLEAYRYYSLAVEKMHGFHSLDAIRLLEKAIALDRQFAMAHARIGYVYLMGGFADQFGKAKQSLERAFQLDHRLTARDKLYIRSWYALVNHDGDEAVRAMREITGQYPNDVETYYLLSYVLRNEARLAEAIEVIKQGLVFDPEAPDLYNRLGFCYAELGRYEEALTAHQRYVQLAPREPNAYDSLGTTLGEAGREVEALAALDQALALNPEFHFAMMHRGDLFYRQGRYRDAFAEYERCLPLTLASYHRGTVYYRLVLVHLRKGDLARAEVAARQMSRYLDGTGALLVALARGDLKAAERVKAQSPLPGFDATKNHITAKYGYYLAGLLAIKSGEATTAIEHFRQVTGRPPLDWGITSLEDCLADAYLELGWLDSSVAEYERLLGLNPNRALAQYHLGQAFERKGEREKARAAYGRFLQIWKDADADIPEVVEAKARLTGLGIKP